MAATTGTMEIVVDVTTVETGTGGTGTGADAITVETGTTGGAGTDAAATTAETGTGGTGIPETLRMQRPKSPVVTTTVTATKI